MPERQPPPGTAKTPQQQWEQADSHRVDRPHDPRRASASDTSLSPKQRKAFLNTRDGVFYPTGHAVLVVERDHAQPLRDALSKAGFPADGNLLLDSEQTVDLMSASEEQAGLLAELVGAEIKNLRVIRQLAEQGACLLIVRVHGDDEERRLVEVAQQWPVHKALRYHTLAIEEMPVGTEDIPGDSPYGVNEVLRNKPSDAQFKPRR